MAAALNGTFGQGCRLIVCDRILYFELPIYLSSPGKGVMRVVVLLIATLF
jgi:hypothetical protein